MSHFLAPWIAVQTLIHSPPLSDFIRQGATIQLLTLLTLELFNCCTKVPLEERICQMPKLLIVSYPSIHWVVNSHLTENWWQRHWLFGEQKAAQLPHVSLAWLSLPKFVAILWSIRVSGWRATILPAILPVWCGRWGRCLLVRSRRHSVFTLTVWLWNKWQCFPQKKKKQKERKKMKTVRAQLSATYP